MDGDEQSQFWVIVDKYYVDIYFAGEVHSNNLDTGTYDTACKLMTVVVVKRLCLSENAVSFSFLSFSVCLAIFPQTHRFNRQKKNRRNSKDIVRCVHTSNLSLTMAKYAYAPLSVVRLHAYGLDCTALYTGGGVMFLRFPLCRKNTNDRISEINACGHWMGHAMPTLPFCDVGNNSIADSSVL